MTTNTSSRRGVNWWSVYRESIKQNRAILIFFSILMLSVPLIVICEQLDAVTTSRIFDSIKYLMFGISLAAPVAMSVIMPFLSFSYLHNRRAVDLYHALPVKRASLFLGKYFSGLTVTLLPSLVGYGMALGLRTLTESGLGALTEFPPEDLLRFAQQILPSLLTLYTFIVFMIICCGTVWETLLYTAGLSLALVAVSLFVPELLFELNGYPSGTNEAIFWLLSFSPYYFFAESFGMQSIVTIIMTVVQFFAALFLYQHRKSENTGSAFAFPFLFHIVSMFIIAALMLAAYAATDELAFVIPLGFLAYFVISVIARRGFKKLLPVFLRGAAAVVVFSAFILSFEVTGGYGYETRVPSLDKIESAWVTPLDVGDGACFAYYYGPSGATSRADYRQREDNIYTAPEEIALIRQIHQEGMYPPDYYEDRVQIGYIIRYKLKNGGVITRQYDYLSKVSFDAVVALNQTEAFRKEKYAFLEKGYPYTAKTQAYIAAPFGQWDKYPVQIKNIPLPKLAEALRKDVYARPKDFEMAPNADFVGKIVFAEDRHHSGYEKYKEQLGTVLVYECDKNTLELLERCGMAGEFDRLKEAAVPSDSMLLRILDRRGYWSNLYNFSNVGEYGVATQSRVITKEEDISFLLQHLQPVYYTQEKAGFVSIENRDYMIPPQYLKEVEAIYSRGEESDVNLVSTKY